MVIQESNAERLGQTQCHIHSSLYAGPFPCQLSALRPVLLQSLRNMTTRLNASVQNNSLDTQGLRGKVCRGLQLTLKYDSRVIREQVYHKAPL